jgi:hypothetical protein
MAHRFLPAVALNIARVCRGFGLDSIQHPHANCSGIRSLSVQYFTPELPDLMHGRGLTPKKPSDKYQKVSHVAGDTMVVT